MFLQVVVAFGSVGTERAEELRLCEVSVHVAPKQRLLLEDFLAQITDKWFLVRQRSSEALLDFLGEDGLTVYLPPVVGEVVQFAELSSSEEDCATTADEKLIVNGGIVFWD